MEFFWLKASLAVGSQTGLERSEGLKVVSSYIRQHIPHSLLKEAVRTERKVLKFSKPEGQKVKVLLQCSQNDQK